MIKCYCDRCGVEVSALNTVHIPDEKMDNGDFTNKTIYVCFDCKKEHEKTLKMLTDIRFLVFANYFEKGGEG